MQETDEALEELKQRYKESEVQMEEHTEALKANIDELRAKINAENNKITTLMQRSRKELIREQRSART